jgi:citrate synthase
MASDTLTITDNRTDRTYTLPIENGAVRAMDLRQIKTSDEDFGIMTYDPAFMNTASCRSSITYIDGERGILEYRGYPIEVLAERCTFLGVAYLLLFGELPNEAQLKSWTYDVTHHSMLHETTKKFMEGFRYDAHPMAMLVSTVAALASQPPAPDQAPYREDADHRRHVLSPQRGLSLYLPRQRSELYGKLHEYAMEDVRAEVRGQPGARARARCSVYPARGP